MENIPKDFWEDAKWAEEHMSELQKKYLEKWVAIVDENETISMGETCLK